MSELALLRNQLKFCRIAYYLLDLKDIAGLGEIVGHVKEIIFSIMSYGDSKKKIKLEIEEKKLKNQGLFLENLKKARQLAEDIGISEKEIKKLIKDNIEQEFLKK